MGIALSVHTPLASLSGRKGRARPDALPLRIPACAGMTGVTCVVEFPRYARNDVWVAIGFSILASGWSP